MGFVVCRILLLLIEGFVLYYLQVLFVYRLCCVVIGVVVMKANDCIHTLQSHHPLLWKPSLVYKQTHGHTNNCVYARNHYMHR